MAAQLAASQEGLSSVSKYYTNTYLLSRGHMFGKLHLGKVAFTDGLEQLVFAYVRLV
jgi:hypothetical protein